MVRNEHHASWRAVTLRELRSLRSEYREIGIEHRVEQIGSFDAGGTEDFTEVEPPQAGGHDVLGRHARHCAEIEPLPFMELGRNDPWAKRLYSHTLGLQLFVQHLRQRDNVGQGEIGRASCRERVLPTV